MDSIKKIIKGAVWAFAAFCAFCILVATCSDDENESNNQTETEQTEQKVKAEKKVETKELKEKKKEDSFLGTYEATDKIGNKVIVTLKSDKTATVKELGGEGHTYYCNWLNWSSVGVGIEIHSPDEPIELVYEAGIRSHKFIYLKDGWLYSYGGVETNNPTLRLKVTKTK